MKRLLIAILLVQLCTPAFAFGRRRGGYATQYGGVPAGHSNATAQGVAEIMAATGTVGHFGGNPGYEGCGMAGSKEAAYAICCYSTMPWRTVDVGYAQRGGMWYCCRRYQP